MNPTLGDDEAVAEDGAPGFVAGWSSGQSVSSCGSWSGESCWVWLRVRLVEGVEELLLGCCDGLGVERGDLGGGLGLLDGALGLGGKDSAIAGGVGVTLSDGGCDAAGAGWGGGRGRECERGLRGSAAAAAVCGEAVCDLAAEGLGGGGRRGGAGRGVGGRGGGIAGRFGEGRGRRVGV